MKSRISYYVLLVHFIPSPLASEGLMIRSLRTELTNILKHHKKPNHTISIISMEIENQIELLPFHFSAAAVEQWVTLEIPSDFPKRWIDAGYSHIHFGAIRLSLNYHGVEGKPVVARLALLDTRYLKYEDACVATVEATMNNGLVMVTLFPNFTMALADPNLMEALKVQIHIVGAPQVEDSIIATLYYQFTYGIQDHAFKLTGCGRQTVRSVNCKIVSKEDGTSEIKFDHSHLQDQPTPAIFPTQMMMQPQGDPTGEHDPEGPDCYCELCHPGAESRMVEKFTADDKPIYFFRDPITGHCPWDEDCSCEMCIEFNFYEEMAGGHHESYKPHKKKSMKHSVYSDLYKRWKDGDPTVGPLGEDNGKLVFLVDYGPRSPRPAQISSSTIHNSFDQPPSSPKPQKIKPENLIQPCYKRIQKWVKKNPQLETKPLSVESSSSKILMFQPTSSSYDTDFRPLKEFTEKEFKYVPKIPSPLIGGKTSAA
ncbi:hypothetical protein V6N12_043023 [Hibiscus sabdariffa]|uniref:Uncharacterized protein n=1 Tax=Hibiscus sabdariffa TaxID=183260 RepID=A0ABR2DIH6_9ROSI